MIYQLLLFYIFFTGGGDLLPPEVSNSGAVIRQTTVEIEHSLVASLTKISVGSRLISRIAKQDLPSTKALLNWQIGNDLPGSYKILFSIYTCKLESYLDPRLTILSSKAHPPTLFS